jgi:predicted 3-demethylubiquinone-9 3-methyltransferase (glyoxalase superfamily)
LELGMTPTASNVITHRVRTCLWFDGQGQEAAELYVSLIPDSRIENVMRPSPDAPVLMLDFTLGGTPYQALNGGPEFLHSEAASISVLCPDQAETDRLWHALTADGGSESMCGWLKDRFGLSWQIVPEALPRLLADPDRAAAGRAMQALMGMRRIVVADLEAAFRSK